MTWRDGENRMSWFFSPEKRTSSWLPRMYQQLPVGKWWGQKNKKTNFFLPKGCSSLKLFFAKRMYQIQHAKRSISARGITAREVHPHHAIHHLISTNQEKTVQHRSSLKLMMSIKNAKIDIPCSARSEIAPKKKRNMNEYVWRYEYFFFHLWVRAAQKV